MLIGLIDVDNWNKLDDCFPNIPLMKISSYYKHLGHIVEWYDNNKYYDIVYVSKVFTFSKDPFFNINSKEIYKGGTGYNIIYENGIEKYINNNDDLPYEIDHSYPDYKLYNIKDHAYGSLTKGCPRGCAFCHVKDKEGLKTYKYADLKEFWSGQKYIDLLDPNILAYEHCVDLLKQVRDTNAYVDFNQGLDIRLMTPNKMEILKQIHISQIHFAFDRYEDKNIIVPKLVEFSKYMGYQYCRSKVQCYVLINFNTTIEEDLDRVMILRELGISPYIMRYNKESIQRGDIKNRLARWCNNRRFFWKYSTFEEYLKNETKYKDD